MGSNLKHVLDIFSTPLMKPILFFVNCKSIVPPPFSLYHPLLCLNVFLLILWQTCLIKEGMHVLKTNSERKFLWQTLHVWLKNVKTDQGYQFSYHGVYGTYKIRLLTYSSNVQRAVEVELSLKSKRESEKKRELGNRHLMHVLALLNTIKRLTNTCKLW